jgi:hypothetical protein
MSRVAPALTLYFLVPALAELLSGSAPPAEFFNPLGFVIMGLLYGGGALLIREWSLRFPQRWRALFILGAAYAIVNEALTAKSFFDPQWGDLGALATYGRWADTAWIWAWGMILYHTVFSVALPIYIVEFIYRDRRNERWLSARGFNGVFISFVAVVLFGYALIGGAGKPFHPSLGQTAGALAAIVGLVLYANRTSAATLPQEGLRHGSSYPPPVEEASAPAAPSPFWFALVGFAYFPSILILPALLNQAKVPALAAILAYVFISGFLSGLVYRWSGAGARWSERHRLALVAGLYLPILIAAPLQDLANKSRPDNTAGMAVVGLWALILGLYLYRLHRDRGAEEGATSAEL